MRKRGNCQKELVVMTLQNSSKEQTGGREKDDKTTQQKKRVGPREKGRGLPDYIQVFLVQTGKGPGGKGGKRWEKKREALLPVGSQKWNSLGGGKND